MDFGIYQNSYLKRYDAIRKYKDAKKINKEEDKSSKLLRAKPIINFINKKEELIDQNKVQLHKNYVDSGKQNSKEDKKINTQGRVKSTFQMKKESNSNEVINYNIIKEGYQSRLNKETTLFNKSASGYETNRKKDYFDIVSISRPIFWPERGYTEIAPVKNPDSNFFKTCYN